MDGESIADVMAPSSLPRAIGGLLVVLLFVGCLGGGGIDPGGADALLGLEDDEGTEPSAYTCEQLKEMNDSVQCDGDAETDGDEPPPIWVVQENDQTVSQEQVQDQAQTQEQAQDGGRDRTHRSGSGDDPDASAEATATSEAGASSSAESESESDSAASSSADSDSTSRSEGSGETDRSDADDPGTGGSEIVYGDPSALEVVDYYILGADPNEEYIVFENTGEDPLDMGGWEVRDREGARVDSGNLKEFTFPSDFILLPGEQITVWTGFGDDDSSNLYWGKGNQVWLESGDTVRVFDENKELVGEYQIEAGSSDGSDDDRGSDTDGDDPDGDDSDNDDSDSGNEESESGIEDGEGDPVESTTIEFPDCDVVEISGEFEWGEVDVTYYADDGADSDVYDIGPAEGGVTRIDASMFDNAISGYAITGVTLGFSDTAETVSESNPADCTDEIRPAPPSISFVDAESAGDESIDVTFAYENPNDEVIYPSLAVADGSLDPSVLPDTFDPGSDEFVVTWTPDSDDETLTIESDLTPFGIDETISASTDSASEYLDGDSDDESSAETDPDDSGGDPATGSGDEDGDDIEEDNEDGADGDAGEDGDGDGDDGDGNEDEGEGSDEDEGDEDEDEEEEDDEEGDEEEEGEDGDGENGDESDETATTQSADGDESDTDDEESDDDENNGDDENNRDNEDEDDSDDDDDGNGDDEDTGDESGEENGDDDSDGDVEEEDDQDDEVEGDDDD